MNPSITEAPKEAQILVVDDEAPVAQLVEQTLSKAGYTCRMAENGRQALRILEQEPIDVVVSDIMMPEMDGVTLLKKVKAEYFADVMLMTGFTEDYNYETLIREGASDFITKPFSPRELLLRLKRVLKMRYLLIERDQINAELEANVARMETVNTELKHAMTELQSMNQQLNQSYLDTINRLCLAAEYKDDDTGDHITRISRYCEMMAQKLGQPEEFVQLMRYASPMHDIGKIGIPDHILLKPGKLTTEEFNVIKTHTTIGANILSGSQAEVLKLANEIALNHHEKWNGKGYPNGLAGPEIPLSARIVGLADTFDALTTKRPYKNPYPTEVALDIIRSEREKHFEPVVVDAFLDAIDEIREIKAAINSPDNTAVSDFIWSERDIENGIYQHADIKQPSAGK
ncbi:MAG: response regulator [Desulfobacterales bacterium]|nr:response regulator [Desulfobacterales bacterium]